jgi:hypothetical protein
MSSIPDPRRVEPDCEPVVLVIDGVVTGDPHEPLRSFRLSDMESVELLQPTDAGLQYGLDASANGALVIWTRGRGPHRSEARNSPL